MICPMYIVVDSWLGVSLIMINAWVSHAEELLKTSGKIVRSS